MNDPDIYMPGRFLDRNVGGNTTYARAIATGLQRIGRRVRKIPAGSTAAATAAKESIWALKSGRYINHWVGDTGPALVSRATSVVTVHGIASLHVSGVRSPSSELLWRARVQRAIDLSARVITVSQSSARDIAEAFRVQPGLIDVIPHGINVAEFRTAATLSPHVSTEVGNRPYLLYLGNIEPRKNVDLILDAFARSSIRRTHSLVIAGRPAWRYSSTLQRIAEIPNCIYLGFVSADDRRALLQGCDLFVFPSQYEGFGFPVLEAMAAGARVLTSTRGSLQEIAGPAHKLETLAVESLQAALDGGVPIGPSSATEKETGLRWLENFSWERSVSMHVDTYAKAQHA